MSAAGRFAARAFRPDGDIGRYLPSAPTRSLTWRVGLENVRA